MMNMAQKLFQIILLASFAMWFGGFGFYVSFVVPIGTEVLGSTFDQGMITRRVTIPLNWLGLTCSVMLLLNSAFGRKSGSGWWSRCVQFSSASAMLLMQLALFWLHPQIDAFVDLQIGELGGDYDQFYFLHRLYLWASTFQWIAAWLWLAAWCSTFANCQQGTSQRRKAPSQSGSDEA